MNKHVVAVAASVFTKLGDGDTLSVDSIKGCTRAISDVSVGGIASPEAFSLFEDYSVGPHQWVWSGLRIAFSASVLRRGSVLRDSLLSFL